LLNVGLGIQRIPDRGFMIAARHGRRAATTRVRKFFPRGSRR